MLYSITKPFAKIALGLYFRKIYFANMEALPKDKPVILAANHPTAFIEPCILACWLDKPLSFIARGDLYVNNKILKKLYDWYHMTPIFRQEDTGYSNLKSNYETFEKCFETLSKHIPLMILVEGRTLHEKRLRPMRKGTARIVFGTLEKHPDLDIQIVPVGINYTDSDAFRSVAMIQFGEPIRCADYKEVLAENPAKAVNQLTQEIGRRLMEKVIHVEQPADDALANALLLLEENDRPDSLFPVASTDNRLFVSQKKLADRLNKLTDNQKNTLVQKTTAYFEALQKNGLTDLGLTHTNWASFKNVVFAVVGFLPAMLGLGLNILPILLGNALAKKMAPSIEFRAATAIVFSSFFYLFYGILLHSVGLALGFGWKVFLLTIIPALGLFYIIYRDIVKKWREGSKAEAAGEELIQTLNSQRTAILRFVTNQ